MFGFKFKFWIRIFTILFFTLLQLSLYAQESDSLPDLHTWILADGYRIEKVDLDTFKTDFHTYSPIDKFSFSNSFLGNTGSQYNSNIFFDELSKPYTDFLPENQFAAYLMTARNQHYYYARRPYIELKYVMSTKKRNENDINVLVTQNINKYWNVGFNYVLISADGIFPQNKTSEHSLNFFTSYTGEKYAVHASYYRNKFRIQESGGIDSMETTDPDLSRPKIDTASSVLYKSGIVVSQEFKFGRTVTETIDDTLQKTSYREIGKLNYVFNYGHNYRNYFDNGYASGFYKDIFMDTTRTLDSTSFKLYDNALYWSFREMKYGKSTLSNSFGAGYEIIKSYGFKGYVFVNNGDKYQSLRAIFNSNGRFNKIRYNLSSYYYLQGYKMNDFSAVFDFQKDIYLKENISTVYLNLELSKRTVALMEQYYNSNHFKWNNNFKSKNTAKAILGLSIPKLKLKLEASYAQLGNYVYFDSTAYPVQLDNSMGVMAVRLEKEFRVWKIHSQNKVVWQNADNVEAVSIPEFTFYHNLYFNLHYKEAMYLNLGYELYYSTEFDALSFMPATGQFYQERLMKTGAYPIINVFADVRIQSVLLFIKFENVSFQFINTQFYYLVNNYPLNPTMFKLGVTWRFRN